MINYVVHYQCVRYLKNTFEFGIAWISLAKYFVQSIVHTITVNYLGLITTHCLKLFTQFRDVI